MYFVNDRISTLSEIKEIISKYVPDYRAVIGHGQIPPGQLEAISVDFMNHDYNVLLSTSIVENGINIDDADAIIIGNTHYIGLSSLRQMGRHVGRNNHKALCYLLAPPKPILTPGARRQLEALETFSGLGGGFSIAVQDLDIHGVGNLLGTEQSNFIEGLGYKTYQKIFLQAVAGLYNDRFNNPYEGSTAGGEVMSGTDFVGDRAMENGLEIYFPGSYVPNNSRRMLLYRELGNIEDDNELTAYR